MTAGWLERALNRASGATDRAGIERRPSRASRVPVAVALLATLLALFLGWVVTPMGDSPDETGHYSYVHAIAAGELFPLIEESDMVGGLWGDDREALVGNDRFNYIVQHPPLYYLVAAVPHAIADALGAPPWVLYRIPRAVSALSLGALLLVVHASLRQAGVAPTRALPVMAGLAFLPMLMHLSGGVSNDVFLFLLCALATLSLVLFVQRQHLADAYWCAFWLTLAGGTKMTAWVFIAPAVAILLFELRRPLWAWLGHGLGLSMLALLLPAWWMFRNWWHFGAPFYRSGYAELSDPLWRSDQVPFLKMLADEPVMNWLFAHFHGLFGFSGYCQTPAYQAYCTGVEMTQLFGFTRNGFTLSVAVAVLVFCVYLLTRVVVALTWGKRVLAPLGRREPAWFESGMGRVRPAQSLAERLPVRVAVGPLPLLLAAALLAIGGFLAWMLLGTSFVDFNSRALLEAWWLRLDRNRDRLALAVLALLLAYGIGSWLRLRRERRAGAAPRRLLTAAGDDLKGLVRVFSGDGPVLLAVLPGLLTAVVLGLLIVTWVRVEFPGQMLGDLQLLLMSAAPLAAFLALGLLLHVQEPRDRLALYAPVVFCFFGSILLFQIYQSYLMTGIPRGVQGRYLYPVLPLLLVALGVALERLRVAPSLCYGVVLLLGFAFADALVERVLPFYLEVRL